MTDSFGETSHTDPDRRHGRPRGHLVEWPAAFQLGLIAGPFVEKLRQRARFKKPVLLYPKLSSLSLLRSSAPPRADPCQGPPKGPAITWQRDNPKGTTASLRLTATPAPAKFFPPPSLRFHAVPAPRHLPVATTARAAPPYVLCTQSTRPNGAARSRPKVFPNHHNPTPQSPPASSPPGFSLQHRLHPTNDSSQGLNSV